MSQDLSKTTVPFHGDTIICIETPEGVFVAIRPICARLGLDFSAQRKRVNRSPDLFGVAIMATEMDAGGRDMVCIRLTRVAYWLATISVNKVKPELREAVEQYQTEAAEVLDHHFRQKAALKDKEIAHLQQMLACCHDFLLITTPKWNEISILTTRRVSQSTIARRVNMSRQRVDEEMELMRDCGLHVVEGKNDVPKDQPQAQEQGTLDV